MPKLAVSAREIRCVSTTRIIPRLTRNVEDSRAKILALNIIQSFDHLVESSDARILDEYSALVLELSKHGWFTMHAVL